MGKNYVFPAVLQSFTFTWAVVTFLNLICKAQENSFAALFIIP